MAEIKHVSSADFQAEVLDADRPVVVDFWAPWCGPCRMMAPVLEAIAEESNGRLKLVKVNTDENSQLAGRYSILGIPALLVFNKGKEAGRIIGFRPQKALQKELDKILEH